LTRAAGQWLLLESVGWRMYVGLCCSPGLVIAAMRALMLESPHFLASVDRVEECCVTLKRIAAINRVPCPEGLSSAALRTHGAEREPWRKEMGRLLGGVELRGRLACAGGLWFALAYGFYGFSVWGAAYFQARGFEPQRSYAALFSSVACQVPGTLVAVASVERVGRRPLLVFFSLGCALSVLAFAASSSQLPMSCPPNKPASSTSNTCQ